MRKDYQTVSQPLPNEDTQHLDDFNDYHTGSNDDAIKWSMEVDKINEEILLRLRLAGKLHPAIKSKEAEQEHTRNLFKGFLLFLSTKYPSYIPQNRIAQILGRELLVCQFALPLIDRMANPEILNTYVLEKATRRIVVQRAVSSFRKHLEVHFSQFPPIFLISNSKPQKFTLYDKQKYVDLVGRYARNATSVIDICAVRHEILREMKRTEDQLSGIDQGEIIEDIEAIKRYNRQMAILLKRLEKRIRHLEQPLSDGSINKSGLLNGMDNQFKTPYITLRGVLEDFYSIDEESGAMQSLSLYYFLEYLELKTEFSVSIIFLRFSQAAENYRRLVSRVNTGILINSDFNHENDLTISLENLGDFSSESHARFQKEVYKIYSTFLSSTAPRLGLSRDILESFKRYIQSLEKGTSFRSDDYLCVMKAQKQVLIQLDDYFSEFLHSDSYFRWVRDLQRIRMLKMPPHPPGFNYDNSLQCEGSALMNDLENELLDICMKITGNQRGRKATAEQDIDDENIHTISAIITLEDMILEGSLGNSSPTPILTSPSREEDEDDLHIPGDLLNSSTKLSSAQDSIDRVAQEFDRVNLLLWKLESTDLPLHDPLYLMQKHILEQTKDQLAQEIGDFAKQKAKYESQEQREALIPGQCTVTIQEMAPIVDIAPSLTKNVTFFLIQVNQKQNNSGWTVQRRYNDFDSLHRRLREQYPMVDDFDFPGKSSVLWVRRSKSATYRMKALERYLQRLIDNKALSSSHHVRNFLSSNFKSEDHRFLLDNMAQKGLKATKAKVKETLSRLGVKNKVSVISFLDGRKKSCSEDNLARDSMEDLSDDLSSEDGSSIDHIHEKDSDNPGLLAVLPLTRSFAQVVLQLFDFKEQNNWLRENAGK
jgi:hypothetical protein